MTVEVKGNPPGVPTLGNQDWVFQKGVITLLVLIVFSPWRDNDGSSTTED